MKNKNKIIITIALLFLLVFFLVNMIKLQFEHQKTECISFNESHNGTLLFCDSFEENPFDEPSWWDSDFVYKEENMTCTEKTFEYFNLTNEDLEAEQLAYLVMQTARGEVFSGEMVENMTCTEKTFEYFNLTNEDLEAEQLAYLVMQTARGEVFSGEMVENMTNKTLDAYIYFMSCLYWINNNDTIIPIETEEKNNNNTFEPIENYTHPLEGQIINWHYSDDNDVQSTPTTIPAIPEFSNILIPIIVMLASIGRVRI